MLVSIGLCPALALAAPDARQQMYDRLQQQDRDRQQQQLDDMRLPGRQPAPAQPGTVDTTVPGPCFTIEQISLYTLDQTPIPFAGWFSRLAGSVRGRCLDLAGVQALQARLSNALIEHGYVTSRVLVPEQDINAGRLTLLVVVGRIGGLRADGLPEKLLRLALPTREGDTVNLRDLEQVVESLSRLPNMKASMDLVPGQQQGETTVVGKAEWPRPYRASLVVDGVRYVGVGHGTAQAGLELGNPFGINDRLSTSLNADLDKTFADRAWGMGIDYDVARGYWNLAMSHGRQQYQNQIDGVFQTFDTAGLTQTSRLELTRTLHRSGRARLDATLFGTYIDVENLLEEAVIRVSSYHLHTAGSRVNGKYLWGQTLLTGSLTAEAGWGTLAALAFNAVGGLSNRLMDGSETQSGIAAWNEGGLGKVALHGVVGGSLSYLTDHDFATGAAAGALNEALSPTLTNLLGDSGAGRTAGSQIAGLVGALAVDGNVNTGANLAKLADGYNRQAHLRKV